MLSDGESTDEEGGGLLKVWNSIHTTHSGFPQCDHEIANIPSVGSVVGSRVLQELIGSGRFGDVYRSTRSDGEDEACKVICKKHITHMSGVGTLWNELRILPELDHPNVVTHHHSMHGPNHIYLFMAHAGRESLFDLLKSSPGGLALEGVRSIQRQMLHGICYCHCKGVAHLDLKPENVRLGEADDHGERRAVLVDFGCAVDGVTGETRARQKCGTMPFVAPEVMLGEDYRPFCVDVWGCGVVLFEMLCGLNALADELGWDRWQEPTAAARATLAERVGTPADLLAVIERRLGTAPPGETADLLTGLMGLMPDDRWTSEQAVACAWLA
eukprot:TRINITY_DN41001_c0_g1_i1.p1 TRINITY_DN41001_c0_g1~~TRINITY_DN41001_c0_g1_i1.p1  ORF type:complete len:328 (-),score=71.12 TRINITY_DN41001_c0_g1_i1:36-1019(-)